MNRWGTAAAIWIVSMAVARAEIKTWTGAGANALASTGDNWSGNIAPVENDSVLFNAAGWKPCTWDLNITLQNWVQTIDYTNIVTIQTRYPGQGAFTNLTIQGSVYLTNGIWTHPANSGNWSNSDCLAVTIAGDFYFGADATLNLDGKGYATSRGPGYAEATTQRGKGASHGGMGGQGRAGNSFQISRPTYGSIFEPVSLGSGGDERGGGSARIAVGGTTTLDGQMTARGIADTYRYAGGAGGSIFLTTGSFQGNGGINVSGRGSLNGTDNSGGGGGGRIAVVLTAADTFGSVTMTAAGGKDSSAVAGAAGTIYLQTQGQARGEGMLIIDNASNTLSFGVSTRMPEPGPYNETPDLSHLAEIVITNKAVLWINTNTVFDFSVPIRAHPGAGNATVVVGGTNGLSFPSSFTVSTDYELDINTTVSATGNWVVPSNTVLTHTSNYTNELYKLGLILNGNLTVELGGMINVDGRGYDAGKGPGGNATHYGYGASHGGMGGLSYTGVVALPTYGSVTVPTSLGSGGFAAGHGAVFLDIRGTTTVHGVISARRTVNTPGYPGSSGGSIYLRTRELRGSGLLDASGQPTSYQSSAGDGSAGGGGGGRVSVVLTDSDSFDNVRLAAKGGPNTTVTWVQDSGAAGTIYTETLSQGSGKGWLLIANDNRNIGTVSNTLTLLPAPAGAIADELKRVTVVISNQSHVALTSDLDIGDLYIRTNTVNYLYLKGWTLKVNHRYHTDWGDTNRVVYDGGQIVWEIPGTVVVIR